MLLNAGSHTGPSSPRYILHYARSSFLLNNLVFFINFLYLCFFILSFLCLFTLISNIVPRSFSARSPRYCWYLFCRIFMRSRKGWRISMSACSMGFSIAGTWISTIGEVDVEYVRSPFESVDSVTTTVVLQAFRFGWGGCTLAPSRTRCLGAALRFDCASSKDTGAGGALNGTNCAIIWSTDICGTPSRCLTFSELDDEFCKISSRISLSSCPCTAVSRLSTLLERVCMTSAYLRLSWRRGSNMELKEASVEGFGMEVVTDIGRWREKKDDTFTSADTSVVADMPKGLFLGGRT